MTPRRSGWLLALTLALLATACGSGSSGSGDIASVSDAYEVKTTNYAFVPAILQGKPGTAATVHLTNSSGTKHNFTLDARKVDQDIEAGKDATVSVTFPESGQLTFVCKYHKSSGMTGTLTTGGNVVPSVAPSKSDDGGTRYY